MFLIMLPALMLAGTPPTVPSSHYVNQNNVREASDLLEDLRAGALEINDDAAELQQFSSDGNVDWEVHASKLEEIKDQINDMGHSLDTLKAIDQAALPWQRDAVQRTLPLVKTLASNATAAINFVSQNPSYLFSPQYAGFQASLTKQSKQLSDLLRNFQNLAKDVQQEKQIRQELKVSRK